MTQISDAAPSRRKTWFTAVLLFVGATALAALMSPSVSLWTDEAITISAAERSPGELWALLQRIDSVHGLYYGLMSAWIDVFGSSPFSLRFPSALAAGGTTVGVYFLTRLLATEQTALLAAITAATLPRLVWSGIEARPFVFSALAAVWATYLFVRALRHNRPVGWIAYGAVAALGVAVNIYLVLLVVGHAITVVILARRDRRVLVGFMATALCVALVSAPLLLLVRSQQAQLGGSGDRNLFSIARKIAVNQFFLGETPDPDMGAPFLTRIWQAAAILAAAIGIALMVVAVLRRSASGDRKRELLAVLAPWIMVPTGLIAVYAVAASPIYQPRYFTFTAPAAAILIAVGIRAAGRRWLVTVAVVAYVACIAIVYVSQRTPFAKSGSDWSSVAHLISEQALPGDAVYFAPRYDDDGSIEQTSRRIAYAYPDDFVELDDLTLLQTGAESNRLDGYSRPLAEATADLENYERVWAVYHQKSPVDTVRKSEALFDARGYSGSIVWDGPTTRVVEYSRED